jgi:HK97 family phage major capsid protein
MTTKWQLLKQQIFDTHKEAEAILTAGELGKRDLTAKEDEQITALTTRLTGLNADLEVEEARRAEERSAPLADERAAVGALVAKGPRFHSLFPNVPLDMGGWKDAEEYFSCLHSGRNDSRLYPVAGVGGSPIRALSREAIPSEGGFYVPTQLVAEMMDASLENEIVRPRADVVPMTTATRRVVGFDAHTSASCLYGNFTGQWVPEGGAITAETPLVRLIELCARKLGLLGQVTNELLSDGLGFGNALSGAMIKAIGWYLDLALLTGDGAAEPLGVLNSSSLITVPKETGQINDTIVIQNLAQMLTRMHPSCVANAVWVCSQSTRAQLLTLALAVGTGGAPIPVLQGSAGKFEMLTIPAVFTEKVPALGSAGDIMLVDFSQYYVGLRSDMSLARSDGPGFATDTVYYRGILRADGMAKWSAPYTPKNGSSLSWAVALGARKT